MICPADSVQSLMALLCRELRFSVHLLDLGRCVVGETGVKTLPIIEHFDVFRNGPTGVSPGREDSAVDKFVFQRGKKRLSKSIGVS